MDGSFNGFNLFPVQWSLYNAGGPLYIVPVESLGIYGIKQWTSVLLTVPVAALIVPVLCWLAHIIPAI